MPLFYGDLSGLSMFVRHRSHQGLAGSRETKARPATTEEKRAMLLMRGYEGSELSGLSGTKTSLESHSSHAIAMHAVAPEWSKELWGSEEQRKAHEKDLALLWHAYKFYFRYHLDHKVEAMSEAEVDSRCPLDKKVQRGDPPYDVYQYNPQSPSNYSPSFDQYGGIFFIIVDFMRLHKIKWPGQNSLTSLLRRASVVHNTMPGVYAEAMKQGIHASSQAYQSDGAVQMEVGSFHPVESSDGNYIATTFHVSRDLAEGEGEKIGLQIQANSNDDVATTIEVAPPPAEPGSDEEQDFIRLATLTANQTYDVKMSDLKKGISIATYSPSDW